MKSLFVRIQGGLGNQLFQYAFARKLSLIYGIKLKLDISFYKKKCGQKFELENFNVIFDIINKEDARKILYKKITYRIFSNFKCFEPRLSNFYILENKEVFSSYYDYKKSFNDVFFNGYWQNENYFKSHRILLLKELTLKKELSEKARNYLECINVTESVSLHVRRGDYTHNPELRAIYSICDIAYFRKAITYITKLKENPYFFIFSDEINWCKDNFSFMKNKTFVETGGVIEDLMLMKQCKHHIISNSSFSWWGAWLSNFEENIVISPKIFLKTHPNINIAPKSWIKLNPK